MAGLGNLALRVAGDPRLSGTLARVLPADTPDSSITYRVLEVYPRRCLVLITCHVPQAPPPVTYTLWGSGDILVTKKVVTTPVPASFTVNVTLKSSPDLLTYSCQAASSLGAHARSARLQLYWELWAKPVSQPQAVFVLQDRGSGPEVGVSCWASSGSPPISYSLVGKDRHIHSQQTPPPGQPANFSIPLAQASAWLQCRAENAVGTQSSAFTLLPPGELPEGPALVLAGSLASITAVTSGMLGWTMWTRL
ncbi:protein IL-40 [Ochotona princeps]|uniref:protein IL-40 n=1 Tax=Ochotona princeps TaxID=9978 RepID=UPI002714823C|nr:protein IL-40 [Ochotona princeps]